jgi:hypothetical protein
MDKTTKLLLKFVGLVVSVTIYLWLLPLLDSVSDKWFGAWLWTTIFSFISAVFFIAWIAESIAHWNTKNKK